MAAPRTKRPPARIQIQDVSPQVDCGRYPYKRTSGDRVDVRARIFRDGHETLGAAVRWKPRAESKWRESPLAPVGNDWWEGSFVVEECGRWCFRVEAWVDRIASWQVEARRKSDAGQADLSSELAEGALVLDRVQITLEEGLAAPAGDRSEKIWSATYDVDVDRERARFGAWYELFPRSWGGFKGVEETLPQLAELGFDVVYLPPIHPIGETNRKGRNNAEQAEEGDVGSPWAIGGPEGGHDGLQSARGTFDDFRRLVVAAREHGLEIAIDFAIQCSPDHPWLKEHPDWFKHRPDGSIRYAENPPKKYEDIVNPDFYCADRVALWQALRDVVLFWVEKGVKIFRVDNPHTKPFPFWEWLIHEVQECDPNVIFLSEAFSRPKIMKGLAKLGFTQSYTYFTWRTHKSEFQEYLTEITRYPERDYFRPNFFVNTPDILPVHLQKGEPWMFKSRVALAATLSSNYGMYSGYELLEHEPIPGREEYIYSEKYELKFRDWNRPGNITDYITRLNRIRRENPALLQTADLRFAQIDDAEVIGFVKESVARDQAVAVAIALNGHGPRTFWFHFGDITIGLPDDVRPVRAVVNLVTGERHAVEWGGVRLTINPSDDPALLFRCET